MWKPVSLLISSLLVVDSFFVSYAVGLNSRHVLVAEPTQIASTASTATAAPRATTSQKSVAGSAKSFTDLSATDSRLQSSLSQAADAGILDPTQDKKFRPNEPVTRADFTRWMLRIKQLQPVVPASDTYTDVKPDNPYYKDIEGATKANMVQGYTVKDSVRKDFRPDQFITRQEFAVMYGTFSGKRGKAEKLSKADEDKYLRFNPTTSSFGDLTYKDAGDIDDWAKKWVSVAHQADVLEQAFDINPYQESTDKRYFRPQQKMTRAEAVNILVKLYGVQSKTAVSD